MSENLRNQEQREEEIEARIEQLAEQEGMTLDDILIDMMTFIELIGFNEDAGAYFQVLAEKLGISFEEIIDYAQKIAEDEV